VLVETAEGDDELQFAAEARKLLLPESRLWSSCLTDTDPKRSASSAPRKPVTYRCSATSASCAIQTSLSLLVSMLRWSVACKIFLTQLAPKGNYVLIGGSSADANAKILHDAQMRVLQPLVDRGDIKIVSDTWTKDWTRRRPTRTCPAAIASAKGEIAAVVASNDGTAGGPSRRSKSTSCLESPRLGSGRRTWRPSFASSTTLRP